MISSVIIGKVVTTRVSGVEVVVNFSSAELASCDVTVAMFSTVLLVLDTPVVLGSLVSKEVVLSAIVLFDVVVEGAEAVCDVISVSMLENGVDVPTNTLLDSEVGASGDVVTSVFVLDGMEVTTEVPDRILDVTVDSEVISCCVLNTDETADV